MLFSVLSKHFNSDDYDSAAPYGKLRQNIHVHYQGSYIRACGNKSNRDCTLIMPTTQILRTYQYFHPQEDRTDQIQRGDRNPEISTARYQKPPKQKVQV